MYQVINNTGREATIVTKNVSFKGPRGSSSYGNSQGAGGWMEAGAKVLHNCITKLIYEF